MEIPVIKTVQPWMREFANYATKVGAKPGPSPALAEILTVDSYATIVKIRATDDPTIDIGAELQAPAARRARRLLFLIGFPVDEKRKEPLVGKAFHHLLDAAANHATPHVDVPLHAAADLVKFIPEEQASAGLMRTAELTRYMIADRRALFFTVLFNNLGSLPMDERLPACENLERRGKQVPLQRQHLPITTELLALSTLPKATDRAQVAHRLLERVRPALYPEPSESEARIESKPVEAGDASARAYTTVNVLRPLSEHPSDDYGVAFAEALPPLHSPRDRQALPAQSALIPLKALTRTLHTFEAPEQLNLLRKTIQATAQVRMELLASRNHASAVQTAEALLTEQDHMATLLVPEGAVLFHAANDAERYLRSLKKRVLDAEPTAEAMPATVAEATANLSPEDIAKWALLQREMDSQIQTKVEALASENGDGPVTREKIVQIKTDLFGRANYEYLPNRQQLRRIEYCDLAQQVAKVNVEKAQRGQAFSFALPDGTYDSAKHVRALRHAVASIDDKLNALQLECPTQREARLGARRTKVK